MKKKMTTTQTFKTKDEEGKGSQKCVPRAIRGEPRDAPRGGCRSKKEKQKNVGVLVARNVEEREGRKKLHFVEETGPRAKKNAVHVALT